MATAAIKKKPTGAPGSVTAPKRDSGGSTTHRVTWKNNSANFKSNNDHRIQGHEWWWVIGLRDTSGHTKRWTTKVERSGNTGLTSASINLGNFTLINKVRTGYNDLFPRKGAGTSRRCPSTSVATTRRARGRRGRRRAHTASRARRRSPPSSRQRARATSPAPSRATRGTTTVTDSTRW